MTGYSFTTEWSLAAPLERVWDQIRAPLDWPEWWRGVEEVVEIEKGAPDGLGAVHRSTWKSALPYRLTFDSCVVRVEPLRLYEVRATGQLEGRGVWTFASDGGGTVVRYDWDIVANKRWMEVLAPVARPVFRWNHDVIMRWGREGLLQRLDELSRVESRA